MAEKWIQKALPKPSKGKLHKQLGVPEGKTITVKKLKKAAHSKSLLMRKRAQLA